MIEQAHIAELRRQNRLLLAKVEALSAIVERIPNIVLNARLDAREDRPTVLPDNAHRRALQMPTF